MSDEFREWLVHASPVIFYLVVWGLVFAGTALFLGLFIPFVTGDTLLFAAGIASAQIPGIDIWVLSLGVAVAAVGGDQFGYWLGRRVGRPYLAKRKSPFIQRMVTRTERFYELFGWWSVVIARYMPWVRVLIPPVAGVSGMGFWRFATANAAGALGWGVLITVCGYFAANDPNARIVAYVIAGVAIAASVVAGVRAVVLDRRARRAEAAAASAPDSDEGPVGAA
ncbi:MAG: DedA family protein [Microbacteriaceae bacterium]|nr:DedA family protein [Microbacteriaceae bacterium]